MTETIPRSRLPKDFPTECWIDRHAVSCGRPATHAVTHICVASEEHRGITSSCLLHAKELFAKVEEGLDLLASGAPPPDDGTIDLLVCKIGGLSCPGFMHVVVYEIIP